MDEAARISSISRGFGDLSSAQNGMRDYLGLDFGHSMDHWTDADFWLDGQRDVVVISGTSTAGKIG